MSQPSHESNYNDNLGSTYTLPNVKSLEWANAVVAEPLGFVDEQLNTVGALTLRANTPTILSLSPAEDFELNSDIIHQWKIVFQADDGQVLGDADYHRTINELKPYIKDQQNGSLLIQPLSNDDLEEILAKTIFA